MSIERFNAVNCDMMTRAIFDDNLTVTAIRIVKLLFIIESKVYNCRNIATMVGMTVWPTHKALKLLVKYGYLIENNGNYTLNLASVLKKEQDVLEKEQPVLEKEPNNIKTNNIKNNKDRSSISDNSPEAPLHLRRYKNEPLKQHSPHVWLTDSSVDSLLEKMKNEQELDYWISELDNSLSKNPKAATDHYLTILRWRRREIGKGMKWEFSEEAKEWIYVKVWK